MELERNQIYYFPCGQAMKGERVCHGPVIGMLEWLKGENLSRDTFYILQGCQHWRSGRRIEAESIIDSLKEYESETRRTKCLGI